MSGSLWKTARLMALVSVALVCVGCWNLEDALRERDRKAAEQEMLIDVRITRCGAAQATGTIRNRNPEATRVSIVIWWTLGGGEPLRTGLAEFAPIGAGEMQDWTAEVTGGPPLDAETAADVECHIESVVAFPF